jgi:arsenite-transporting ATPase
MVVEMAVEGRYNRIIWDTAPTGETLNLLHMPKLMKGHLKAGAKIYEAVDRLAGAVTHKRTLAGIMEEWVNRSEGLSKFLKENTLFFIVANPEALVVKQAERFMYSLRESNFEVRGMIINRLAEVGGSRFLERMRRGQQPYVEQLLSLAKGLAVARIPFTLDEIHGLSPLRVMGDRLLKELDL